MAAGTQIEWIPGFPRGTFMAGNMVVLFVSYVAGFLTAERLGIGPQYIWSPFDVLLTLGAMAVFTVPAIVSYALLMPSTANLGLMSEGLIVEMGTRKWGFRQAYRWSDLKLQGSRLVLPRIRARAPRSMRLTSAQFKRVAPIFAGH